MRMIGVLVVLYFTALRMAFMCYPAWYIGHTWKDFWGPYRGR